MLKWPTPHPPQPFPIVEVLWIDSAGGHGWKPRQSELEHPDHGLAMVNRSVGYLIESTEDWVTLTEGISANDMMGCYTSIPKFAIVRQRTLANNDMDLPQNPNGGASTQQIVAAQLANSTYPRT